MSRVRGIVFIWIYFQLGALGLHLLCTFICLEQNPSLVYLVVANSSHQMILDISNPEVSAREKKNTRRIAQIIGPVLDVPFTPGKMP